MEVPGKAPPGAEELELVGDLALRASGEEISGALVPPERVPATPAHVQHTPVVLASLMLAPSRLVPDRVTLLRSTLLKFRVAPSSFAPVTLASVRFALPSCVFLKIARARFAPCRSARFVTANA